MATITIIMIAGDNLHAAASVQAIREIPTAGP